LPDCLDCVFNFVLNNLLDYLFDYSFDYFLLAVHWCACVALLPLNDLGSQGIKCSGDRGEDVGGAVVEDISDGTSQLLDVDKISERVLCQALEMNRVLPIALPTRG
jgi:hypothetical protein